MPKINGVKVTESQAAIHAVLNQYGPLADHALVPLAQHQLRIHQSSSGIRSRRAELATAGLVQQFGTSLTGSGRPARVWAAV